MGIVSGYIYKAMHNKNDARCRSLRNQRIERLWRELGEQVAYQWRAFFLRLELHHGLDEHELTLRTRKLLWKLDTRILPILALLFLCSFLDRRSR